MPSQQNPDPKKMVKVAVDLTSPAGRVFIFPLLTMGNRHLVNITELAVAKNVPESEVTSQVNTLNQKYPAINLCAVTASEMPADVRPFSMIRNPAELMTTALLVQDVDVDEETLRRFKTEVVGLGAAKILEAVDEVCKLFARASGD